MKRERGRRRRRSLRERIKVDRSKDFKLINGR